MLGSGLAAAALAAAAVFCLAAPSTAAPYATAAGAGASALFVGNLTLFDAGNEVVGSHSFAINTTSLSNTAYVAILSNCTPYAPTTTHVNGTTQALETGAVFHEVYTVAGTSRVVGGFDGRELQLRGTNTTVVSANGWLGDASVRVSHNGDTIPLPPACSGGNASSAARPVVRFYNKFAAGAYAGLEVVSVAPAADEAAFAAFLAQHCGAIP